MILFPWPKVKYRFVKNIHLHPLASVRIERLLELGSISLLDGRLEPVKGVTHNFDKRAKGVTLAYHRGRNDVYHAPDEWEDEEDYVRNTERAYWAEYVYLWKDGWWMVYNTSSTDCRIKIVGKSHRIRLTVRKLLPSHR